MKAQASILLPSQLNTIEDGRTRYIPGNQSTNRPPRGQSTENTTGVWRQTFQENGCVNGQISADAKTQTGIKRTCASFDVSLMSL